MTETLQTCLDDIQSGRHSQTSAFNKSEDLKALLTTQKRKGGINWVHHLEKVFAITIC